MAVTAAIYGFAGLDLTEDEIAFFREAEPWGYIVFARNIETPEQVLRATDRLRDLSGRADLPILVDQEGGRVTRFKEPHWRKPPPAAHFGKLYEKDPAKGLEAVRLNARLLAAELGAVGVNVNCLPMLDVRAPEANDVVIGDRAFGETPGVIAALGRAAAEGLLAGGCLPVMKHLPGHGRATVDSHHDLPVVEASLDLLEAVDFAPFRALRDLPIAMTGHLIFTALDPETPSTLSRIIIEDVIRSPQGLGFEGLLLTDDISMNAIGGSYGERVRRSLGAGCDIVLHCNGDMAEMTAIADEAPILCGKPLERAEKALKSCPRPDKFDSHAEWNRLQRLVMEIE